MYERCVKYSISPDLPLTKQAGKLATVISETRKGNEVNDLSLLCEHRVMASPFRAGRQPLPSLWNIAKLAIFAERLKVHVMMVDVDESVEVDLEAVSTLHFGKPRMCVSSSHNIHRHL